MGAASTGTATTGTTPMPTNTGGGVANNAAVTLQLAQQYVSFSLLVQPRSMAVDTQGTQVAVLSQNTASMLALVSFHTNPQNSCA